MVWLIVIAIQPLVTRVSAAGLAWIVAGSGCHFFAVLGHAASSRG